MGCDCNLCSDKGPSTGNQGKNHGRDKAYKLSKKRKKDSQDSLSDIDDSEASVSAERLKDFFEQFSEIESGPKGLDPTTGRFKGYAIFVYRTAERWRVDHLIWQNSFSLLEAYNSDG
ncbi:hypothetical protein CASFOL_042516 [Castilleja foliolosa]|uniref:Uncharacterized protein n=1 Tax=Castilleja foliolosa TaxID=1961234 RepID=A0ABD3BAR8_9LAMI